MSGTDAPETRADIKEALRMQVRATEPARSVWVGANAGTGKTTVLVDRISRLLLAGTAPAHILCLTFTKAAAAEMVNRLTGRLGAWAMADDASLAQDLAKLLDRPPEDAEIGHARTLFAAALDAPGGMHIRTIHSFCESLLGRFPLEARVAPNAQVVDERAAQEILVHARDGVFEDAARGDAALHAAFAAAAGRMDETRFNDLMDAMVKSRGRLEAVLDTHGGPDGVLAHVRRGLGLADDETEDSVIADAVADMDDGALERLAAAYDNGAKGDQNRAQAVRAWLSLDAAHRAERWDDLAACFLKKDRRPLERVITKGAREADPGAEAIAFAVRDRLARAAEKLRAVACAADTDSLVRIAAALLGAYEARKTTMAALDYDDLILKARALLDRDGATGWVHYKLDGGLHHVLVDEAQDTSMDQWSVIEALAGEFFSGEGAYDEAAGPRTVFAVGDVKQSIYSFQGADPDHFEDLRTRFQARADAAGADMERIGLEVSFRSTPSVLSCVDAVFADEEARDGLGPPGQTIRHLPSRSGQAGLVELWPTVDPDERPEGIPWDAPLDQESERSPAARLAAAIAETVAGWLTSGERLDSLDRPIRPGDIMILVRRRANLAQTLVRALKTLGIPVAGADRMVLTEQIAVQDLMALGDVLLLPEDDLTLATVLKGPLFDFTDDDLLAFAPGRKGSLYQALRTSPDRRHKAAAADLDRLRDRVDYETPYRLFAHVLNDGGRVKWFERLGVDAADPVDAFLARALDFERDHAPTMQGFLHWMRTGAPELKRDLEQTTGAVRVMTVHGSKGLQAPVVILPDTCAPPVAQGETRILWGEADGDPPVLWKPNRDDEPDAAARLREAQEKRRDREYRRLLYVAMTRARDRLYVCGYTGRNTAGVPDGSWYAMVRTAFDDGGPLAARGLTAHEHPDLGTIRRLWNPQTADAKPDDVGAGPDAAAPPPAWLKNPPPAEPVPARPLQPSRPPDTDAQVAPPFADDGATRFKRGTLIHRLLQALPDVDPEARAGLARRWLARPAHGLSDAEQAEIAAETLAVLDDPAFAPVFGPGSRAEVPVVGVIDGPDGPESVAARIDRLVVTEDAVLVVDFKTNRPPPASEANVDAAYIRQMALYRALMRNAFPGRTVDCALVWTLDARLMPVSHAAMDDVAPSGRAE